MVSMEDDIMIIKDAVVHNLTESRSHMKHIEDIQEAQQRVIDVGVSTKRILRT
ncbi:hypothetical protein P4S95_10335 [Aneurinibacillus aneurinilyticus]|uniref:hypothetical protein n=1 Tax=Aneurinibacillus aneurinilyticus TaxID=1391 RepID=UPI002E1A1DBD|nr:hypothetical protein [Aneurinibacillus aneurinilyticus]